MRHLCGGMLLQPSSLAIRCTVPVPIASDLATFNIPAAFDRAVYLRPTEFHTLSDGALEACFYSLSDHRPLELSKRAGYLENELATLEQEPFEPSCVGGFDEGDYPT